MTDRIYNEPSKGDYSGKSDERGRSEQDSKVYELSEKIIDREKISNVPDDWDYCINCEIWHPPGCCIT